MSAKIAGLITLKNHTQLYIATHVNGYSATYKLDGITFTPAFRLTQLRPLDTRQVLFCIAD